MIIAIIFILHSVFLLYIFYIKWKSESFSSGIVNAILVIILFAVGWTISTSLTKLIIPQEGFGKELNQDSISLILLTVVETVFYKFYYWKAPIEDEKEIQ